MPRGWTLFGPQRDRTVQLHIWNTFVHSRAHFPRTTAQSFIAKESKVLGQHTPGSIQGLIAQWMDLVWTSETLSKRTSGIASFPAMDCIILGQHSPWPIQGLIAPWMDLVWPSEILKGPNPHMGHICPFLTSFIAMDCIVLGRHSPWSIQALMANGWSLFGPQKHPSHGLHHPWAA